MRSIGKFQLFFATMITGVSLPAITAYAGNEHEHRQPGTVFIENKGQWDSAVRYKADVRGATVFLEDQGLLYTKLEDLASQVMHDASELRPEERKAIQFKGHAWRMRFLSPSPDLVLKAGAKASFYHNYFLGNDRHSWASQVPVFGEVTYSSVWPGVDMVLRSHEGHLKYDLVVAPNADVTAIGLAYDGLDEMSIDADGHLVLKTSVGELVELAPTVFYGDGDGGAIACRYVLDGNELRFAFPEGYNKSRRVIIDPVLIAGTYSGATGASNYGHCAAYDDSGNIYTGARNFGPTYPATVGAFQTSYGGGGTDIVLSKLNPDGSQLIWAAYLGGSEAEQPHSMIANASNELIVLGGTNSPDFPVTAGAYDATVAQHDITVTRISEDGTTLLGSTLVGGDSLDGYNNLWGNYGEPYRGEVYLDHAENIIVASFTTSSDFPITTNALQTTLSGEQDGVVFKLDPNCTTLLASTFLGGSAGDAALGVRVADNGEMLITGYTNSTDHPTTAGAHAPTALGGTDAYVVRLSADLGTLVAGTYFGTSDVDRSYFIDLDSQGMIWIYGQTEGYIPIQPTGTWGQENGKIFLSKLDASLATVPVNSVMGIATSSPLTPVAFLVDACDNIYISGYNASQALPLTADALAGSGSFYLAVYEAEMNDLLFATFLGGSHVDGGTSRFNKNGIIYQGVCSGMGSMQSTPWAYAATQLTSWDIGVTKIDMELGPVLVDIEAENMTGAPFETLTFSAQGDATSFFWDAGDGEGFGYASSFSYAYGTPGVYVLTLIGTDNASCNVSDTAYVTITITNGLSVPSHGAGGASIRVQPNPNSGNFEVLLPSGNASAEIFDRIGRTVAIVPSIRKGVNPLDLELSPGIYAIHVHHFNGHNEVVQFIVE